MARGNTVIARCNEFGFDILLDGNDYNNQLSKLEEIKNERSGKTKTNSR